MSEPIRIDGKLALPLPKQHPDQPKSHAKVREAAARHVQQELKKQAAHIPNTELVVVVAEGSGKALYDVVGWNAAESKDVFLVTYDALGPLQVGSTAIQRRYANGEPYLKGPGSSFLELPLEEIIITLGEWMQTEGNFYLARSSKVNIFPSPTIDGPGSNTFIDLSLNTEEEVGMTNLLGMCAGTGSDSEGETTGVGTLYFVALVVPNSGLTAAESLQIRAYETFPGNTLKWTLTFPISGTNPNRSFRANIFWDKDRRIITAAERKLWSVKVPATGTPTLTATSEVDATLSFSAAGPYGLACLSLARLQAYKRGDNLLWTPVGSPFSLSALGPVTHWLASAPNVCRPWPFDPVDKRFRVVFQGPKRVDILLSVDPKTGAVSPQNLDTPNDGSADVEFSAALDAGDDFLENGYDYSTNTFIPQGADAIGPDFTGFPAFYDIDLGAGNIPFQAFYWGGRQAFGRLFIPYPPASLDSYEIWYYNQNSGGGGGPNPVNPFPDKPATAGPEDFGYLCPRRISNDQELDGDYTYKVARWPEQVGAGNPDEHIPCLQEDSDGNLIYAKIVSIRAAVPNPNPTMKHFQKPAEDTDNGLGGTISYHQSDYTFYHWPQQEFIHETFLFKVSRSGGVQSLSLSQALSGLTYSRAGYPPGYFPVTLTEMLKIPENVWAIKLGSQKVEGQDDTAWTDAIFALHDWRTGTSSPRLRLSNISSALAIVGTLDEISPTDVIEGGDFDGLYQWIIDSAKIFVNIGILYQWALVGVFSHNRENEAQQRVDLHLVNLANLAAPTVDLSLYEDDGSLKLPRPEDFDRFTATSSGIYWIQKDPGDSLHKFWSLLHT